MLPLRYRATSYNKKSIISQFLIGVGLSLGIWGFGFALGRKRTLVVGSVHGNRLSFFFLESYICLFSITTGVL